MQRIQKQLNPLVELRDPQVALQILSSGDSKVADTQALLCICCESASKCQWQAIGLCGRYTLDEEDVSATERRILSFFGITQQQ